MNPLQEEDSYVLGLVETYSELLDDEDCGGRIVDEGSDNGSAQGCCVGVVECGEERLKGEKESELIARERDFTDRQRASHCGYSVHSNIYALL
jgi:hypothetical protein